MENFFAVLISFSIFIFVVSFASCSLMALDSCTDFNRQATKTLQSIQYNDNTIVVRPVYQVPEIEISASDKGRNSNDEEDK